MKYHLIQTLVASIKSHDRIATKYMLVKLVIYTEEFFNVGMITIMIILMTQYLNMYSLRGNHSIQLNDLNLVSSIKLMIPISINLVNLF